MKRPEIVVSLEEMLILFNVYVDREDYERAAAFLDAVLSLNDNEQQADADA